MSITYNIGTLAAELSLSAISARHGGVIRHGLTWTLTSKRQKTYHSSEPQPLYQVTPGEYTIEAVYNEATHSFGLICLERNTHTDLVVLLQTTPGRYDPNEEYFINPKDMSSLSETERRKMERQGQRKYGTASGPLHEFDAKMQHSGELKSMMKGIRAHPLLSVTAQFDGMGDDPTLRIDNPESNEESLAKTIQLTLQKQLDNQPGPNPGPRPY